ncbi:class I SAM-dependent methyltransferase [Actinomycetospora callitridis]|uniref:class I SAM-dependent methyltransferase n=1 Tax=Actinomycetospora callitridis TaxID=913944 RepID=UPI0023664933|nr:class I SAM-dependent methyltransferase [Actinomycetospora callitridis]MDD7916424.1 class I SAM-dependent methyltransferase [Actinomycetospora callitridis]
MTALHDPVSGRPLTPDTPHSLSDGARRWPVFDGIPYLRVGRDELVATALAALDDGRVTEAAAALLADNDDWWDQPPPPPDALADAYRAAADPGTTLRDAVAALGLGRVGDYFLHRDHDPSGLAVTALVATHPPAGRAVVDLACGAGHLLRRLALEPGEPPAATGVDIVFAKLWLARRFVLPPHAHVRLVCADLRAGWPIVPDGDAWVSCHDTLYFLDDPGDVLRRAGDLAGSGGAVLAAHCHNVEHPLGAAGHPRSVPAWAGLLPGALTYAEEELTAAALAARPARPAEPGALRATEAVALALDRAGAPPRPDLLGPAPGAELHPNPLYRGGVRRWPNPRWADEYGDRVAAYLPEHVPVGMGRDEAARRRVLVELPDRW